MGRPVKPLSLSTGDIERLNFAIARKDIPEHWKQRCKILLLRSKGLSQSAIAVELAISRVTVSKWLHRFAKDGLTGLNPRKRPQCAKVEEIRLVAMSPPLGNERHTLRSIASETGVSRQTVYRALQMLWGNDRPQVGTNDGLQERLERAFLFHFHRAGKGKNVADMRPYVKIAVNYTRVSSVKIKRLLTARGVGIYGESNLRLLAADIVAMRR